MDDKILHILGAAKARFMRYGYAKTTMGDIASEAGVARQTLYNMFTSKEEIMRVVVRYAGEASLQQITSAWENAPTFADKLALFHQNGPVAWYQEIRKAPDWADLMDGMHAAASEEMDQIEGVWREQLTTIFRAEEADLDDATLKDVVDFFYMASLNAKHGAVDVAHLERRLETTRKATLALLKV